MVTGWLAIGSLAIGWLPTVAHGQGLSGPGGGGGSEPPSRGHIYLPRGGGGATALSSQIASQAMYMAAMGDFLESAAIARRHNALAEEQEMRNAVQWVSTYFERRRLNREYRAQEDPSYLERERIRKQKYESLVTGDFETAIKGDLTEKLNWMLHEIQAVTTSYHFTRDVAGSLVGSEVDQALESPDVHHIRFTDGGKVNGKSLIFRADSAEVLDARWPRVLRAPEFESMRAAFERTRQEVVAEIRSGKDLSYDSQQKLMDCVDSLCAAFNAAYPPSRQAESSATFTNYVAGKHFLQSLAMSVYRAIETNDQRAFDGSYRFEGKCVAELLGHMYQYGLEYGGPETGDEAT
ncbi:MAG TPA: hypothetical protein VHY20_13315, partial [Pirellulales bacterium]|nr:hypothetical protein [Pirellulales bacterium]